jgi:hypothetical protein
MLSRLRQSPKVRTNSNAINFVNLPHSTVPFEMMRIKPARTVRYPYDIKQVILTFGEVVKSDIASTIAQNNATSQRTSSAVSAGMQATWLETVPIDKEDRIGAMVDRMVVLHRLGLKLGSEELTKLIVLMR